MSRRTFAVIGPGRAGCTFAAALVDVGWTMIGVAGRTPDADAVVRTAERFQAAAGTVVEVVESAALVVITTPDGVIGEIAAEIAEAVMPSSLVIHLSGAVALAALDDVVARIGALHPLHTMPTGGVDRPAEEGPGARGLSSELVGTWCATAGDPEVDVIARSLGMIPFPVLDVDRARYHAAACIASNHLVALLAQVEASTDVPLEAFLPLVAATVENVAELGLAAALTGPVARGDVETVRAHLRAIPVGERAAYVAMARRAAVLAGRDPDSDPKFGGVLE